MAGQRKVTYKLEPDTEYRAGARVAFTTDGDGHHSTADPIEQRVIERVFGGKPQPKATRAKAKEDTS